MIILIDAENAFDKIQRTFMIKKNISHQRGYRVKILQHDEKPFMTNPQAT